MHASGTRQVARTALRVTNQVSKVKRVGIWGPNSFIAEREAKTLLKRGWIFL
jgi:ornithine cyclodeaminase/alanine dehydrogenase-like protein (mu-crystallin family)